MLAGQEGENMVSAVYMYLKVPVHVRPENGRFISSCFLLDQPQEGPTKHAALEALTHAAQSFMTSCCKDRRVDALLHEHDLRVLNAGEEITSGRYIDVSVMLRAPE